MNQQTVCDCGHLRNDPVPAAPPSEQWLTRIQLSERWEVRVAQLAHWAHKGTGPRYARFGNQVRYRLSDVIAYEEQSFK